MKPLAQLMLLLAAGMALSGCASPQAESRHVRVLCYNMHHGRGMDGQIDLKRIAGVIKSANPDLVSLQEIDRSTRRSEGVDQLAELARLTGLKPYFGKCSDYRGGEFGQAVLSRWELTNDVLPLPGTPELGPRILQVNRVVDDGVFSGLTLLSTHFSHGVSPADRLAQVEAINQWLRGQDQNGLMILTGDLNATPETQEMQDLMKNWLDTAAINPKPTFKADAPRIRIDYILARPSQGWTVIESRVLDESMASDHRPVLAVLKTTQPLPRSKQAKRLSKHNKPDNL